MYIYSFTHFAWSDRVFHAPHLNANPWDLLSDGVNTVLALGEEIAFPELINSIYTWAPLGLKHPQLLSAPTLELLHRMVKTRYSTYKNVIKLFLDPDIDALLAKKPSKLAKKSKKTECRIGIHHIQTDKDQILVVFPDLWTRENSLYEEQNTLSLQSLQTQAKKNLNRWKIKEGSENLLLATSSEIFQDFKTLARIYLLEPQKRYYASQQDPRYKVQTVLQKIAELHQAQLITIESEDLISPTPSTTFSASSKI